MPALQLKAPYVTINAIRERPLCTAKLNMKV